MFFPTMVELEDKDVLIVGGGKVAYRKAKVMLEFGGRVSLVSPDFLDEFKIMLEVYKDSYSLNLIEDKYKQKYIIDKFMVIAATSSREINRQVIDDCKESGILVNNVDGRKDSDFITPAIYKNDNLTISISTGGSFPYLSKKIRREIESQYKKYNAEYLSVLEEVRYDIIRKYPDKKRQIMDKILRFEIDALKNFRDDLRKEDINKD